MQAAHYIVNSLKCPVSQQHNTKIKAKYFLAYFEVQIYLKNRHILFHFCINFFVRKSGINANKETGQNCLFFLRVKQPFCRRIPIQSIAFLLVLQEGGRHQPSSNRQTKTTGFWPFVVKAIFSLVDYTFSSLLQLLLSSDRTSFLVLYKTFPIVAPWILRLFPLKI